MLKKSVFLIIFFILPITGYTLGLGDITVFSKLNEPLKIQIELIQSKTTPLDDILVKNASIKTYRRANLPFPETFNKVRFKPKKTNNGSIIVELTTRRPVRDPFITFIADLKWRKGHVSREYTFLLDPPEFVQKQIYQKKSKRTKTQKATPSKKSSTLRTPRKVTHKKIDYSSVIANHVDGETYSIKRADTLWNIAKKVKPGKNVTTYQTMQALFALNPNAFINNNINLIKQGQTLKIPTQNEILQINGKPPLKNSVTQAKTSSTISKQNASKKTSPTSDIDKKPSQEPSNSTEESEGQAQLKIIPPTEVLLNTPVTSKKDLIIINKALQNSITTIKSLKSENEVLSQQISALTDKLSNLDSKNQNLNNKISEITAQLNNNSPNKPVNQETTSGKPSESISDAEITHDSTVTTENKAIEVDSSLAQTGKSRSFIRELLTSPVITIALAIFTIIILVAALFTIRNQTEKRKTKKHNAYVPFPAQGREIDSRVPEVRENNKDSQQDNSLTPSTLQGTDIGDDKDEDDMDFFEYFEKKINAPDAETNENKVQDIPSEEKAEEATEIDFNLDISPDEITAYEKSITQPSPKPASTSLSEINTYLAYGNYEEAEKHILTELKRLPSDKNLHLKLFECYTFSNKRYEFIKHAQDNINLLNIDMVLRHRIESVFQQTWNEPLDINSFN